MKPDLLSTLKSFVSPVVDPIRDFLERYQKPSVSRINYESFGLKDPSTIPTPKPKKTGPGYDAPMLQPGSRGVPLDGIKLADSLGVGSQGQNNFDIAEIERKIRQGFRTYSGKSEARGKKLPVEDYIPVILDAIQKYDLFKQNPYLIPQISILETSGGQYVTRPNNLINYGVRDPKINALFGQVGMEDALRRSLREIGDTGNAYKRFRTGKPLTPEELQDFAGTYEPMNESYYNNLSKGLDFFGSQ